MLEDAARGGFRQKYGLRRAGNAPVGHIDSAIEFRPHPSGSSSLLAVPYFSPRRWALVLQLPSQRNRIAMRSLVFGSPPRSAVRSRRPHSSRYQANNSRTTLLASIRVGEKIST